MAGSSPAKTARDSSISEKFQSPCGALDTPEGLPCGIPPHKRNSCTRGTIVRYYGASPDKDGTCEMATVSVRHASLPIDSTDPINLR
jgi:hypothetical protein